MSTCEAMFQPFPLLGPDLFLRCDNPGVSVWELGCVHEHVVRRVTCADHQPVPGRVGCWACLEADGHDCEMTFRQLLNR